MKGWIVVLIVAVVAAAAGYGVSSRHSDAEASKAAAADIWTRQLPDPAGLQQPLAQWRGKVVVINFWATWCPPCREEIPLFVRIQREMGARGAQFVGIAIDEPGKVAAFMREYAMNYPVLVGQMNAADWSRRLGNKAGGLPFTVIVGRDGSIRMTQVGVVKEAVLRAYLETLL